MRKIISYSAVVCAVILSASFVFAQEPSPPPNSAVQQWFCLKPVNSSPSEHTTSLVLKDGLVIDQTKPVYVITKIAFDVGDLAPDEATSGMTTGDSTLDTHVFNGIQGLLDLQSKLGFRGGVVAPGTNPTNTFPITWKDDLTKTSGGDDERAHFWYGMQEVEAGGGVATGNEGAQQQGTFTFDKAQGASDCAYVSWDPFGYVFDSVTFGPVKGVYVRLLSSKTENGTYTPVPVGIGAGKVTQNPVTTNADGSYKFYVDPGYYKLELAGDVNKSATKYVIEQNLANIKPGYEDFGYQQIYIAEKPEVIHEVAGKVERRDIAIQTIGAPAPQVVDGPKIKELIVSRATVGGEAKVRVSGKSLYIPMDIVGIYKDANGAMVEEKKYSLVKGHKYLPSGSNNERRFDIWMDAQTQDKKGSLVEIKTTSKYSTKTYSFKVTPMPSYLDGIALDRTGKPMVEGTVRVIPQGSQKASFMTVTDKDGHFTVKSDQLPPLPYSLSYTSVTGDVVKVSTTEYLKQNAEYHKEKLVDSYGVVLSKPNPASVKTGAGKPNDGSVQQQPTGTMPVATNPGVRVVIMIAIAIMVLAMVAVGALVVAKSKHPEVPPPQI